ncbi:FixH family protein [Marinomonas sp.]|nr:hypothetical protein [Marinomonas sp.]MDB4838055.1 FixH family protein [Marinomonas sp.]
MGIKLRPTMKAMRVLMPAFLLCMLNAPSTLACTLPDNADATVNDVTVNKGDLLVSINFLPKTLEIGSLHSLMVHVCRKDNQPFAGKIKADAIMPAHNHGMNYQPRFTVEEPGQFKGTGFVFHMPGVWRLRLTLESDSQKTLIEHDFLL